MGFIRVCRVGWHAVDGGIIGIAGGLLAVEGRFETLSVATSAVLAVETGAMVAWIAAVIGDGARE